MEHLQNKVKENKTQGKMHFSCERQCEWWTV